MRARIGLLLAASLRGFSPAVAPRCRWLLSYRDDAHGRVERWLKNALEEAERLGLEAAAPLSGNVWRRTGTVSIPLFGAPAEDSTSASKEEQARAAFLQAIRAPLELERDGRLVYPFRFADANGEDHAERLAAVFAAERLDQPEAALVPQLQVVLQRLIEKSAGDINAVATVELRVPAEAKALVDAALRDHLDRSLTRLYPSGSPGSRRSRTLALIALRELASDTPVGGRRGRSEPARSLAAILGEDGEEILEALANPDVRLLQKRAVDDDVHYVLTHDSLAEAVVRLADEEELGERYDPELLTLQRQIAHSVALFAVCQPLTEPVPQH